MEATIFELTTSSPDRPGALTACGPSCAARYLDAVGQLGTPTRRAALDRCTACVECGLVMASESCDACSGAGCGVFDWSATRQAAEFTAAFQAAHGRRPGLVDVEAARLFATARPDVSGQRIVDAFIDSADDAAALEADLD